MKRSKSGTASKSNLHGLTIREFAASEPLELYRRLRQHTRLSFVLESAPGIERLSRYTYIGFDPAVVFTLHDGAIFVDGKEGGRLWRPS